MTTELSIVPTNNLDRDLYASSHARERALNTAIIHANISESFEEYLEIFDEFYADDVEVSSETEEESIHGKARVRSLLANFLVPLHIMAENRRSADIYSADSDSGRFCGRDAFHVDT